MTARRVALTVFALATVGCGVHPSDKASFQADESVPFGLLDATTTTAGTTPPAPDAITVRVCLIDNTGTVQPLPRTMPAGFEIIDLAKATAQGPSAVERQTGWTTGLPGPELVASVTVSGGVAAVDLTEPFTSMPTDDQLKAVTQLVCTLTGQPGIGQVQFTVDRVPVAVPRGDGSASSDPVSRNDYDHLIKATTAGQTDPHR
jgi:hypothetical protein